MQSEYRYKNNPKDKITWIERKDIIGEWLFTFDGVKVYNMFEDYPDKLTAEERAIFDKENPYWRDFFKDRLESIYIM